MKKIITMALALSSVIGFSQVGNVGINTEQPSSTLDVNGNARVRQLTDATTQESTYTKAVVADANGNLAVVSRTTPNLPNATQTIFGQKTSVNIVNKEETLYQISRYEGARTQYRYAGQSITLPPGKWVVYCGYIANIGGDMKPIFNSSDNTILTPRIFLRGLLSDNSNEERDPLHVGVSNTSKWISLAYVPNSYYTMTSGLWLVDNDTNTNKTYYLKISIEAGDIHSSNQSTFLGFGDNPEDYMIAIRRQ